MKLMPGVALTALVLLAACSGQGSAAPTPSPSAASPAPTATVTASPPTPAAAPGTPTPTPPAGPCPSIQADPVGDGLLTADLDGDGQDDVLGTGSGAGTTNLNARLATGTTASVGIGPNAPAEGVANSPRFLGATDADGDGRQEVFVRLDSGLAEPAAVVRLVQLVGCELTVVANAQGEPYDFLVGTRTLDAELNPPAYELFSVGCVDADADGRQDLVGLTSRQTGSQVDWTRTIVALDGGAATNGAVDEGRYTSPADDAAITLLSQATCGEVLLTPPG